MGQVQGGFVSAMLDEAMSLAVVVASKLTCVAPTLEMKTSFMRPAMPGHLIAVGWVAKWGRTVAFTEGELADPAGKLLAKATATVMPALYSQFKSTKGAVGDDAVSVLDRGSGRGAGVTERGSVRPRRAGRSATGRRSSSLVDNHASGGGNTEVFG